MSELGDFVGDAGEGLSDAVKGAVNTCTVPVSAHIRKSVTCEGCGLAYVYFIQAAGVGEVWNPYGHNDKGTQRRAREAGLARLHLQAEDRVAPIPCPVCGRVQQHMFGAAREGLRQGMRDVGLWLLIL